MKKILFLIATTLISTICAAQEGIVQVMNSKLYAMYHKSNYDTNYVVRPLQRFNAQVLLEGGTCNIQWTTTGYRAIFKTYDKTAVGVKFSYMGLGGGYSFFPKYANSDSDDAEAKKYGFHYYGRVFGGELSYLKSGRVGGDITNVNLSDDKFRDTLTQKSASASLYYVYNNKKFSYPAAFTSGYLQLKRCGSLLFGMSLLYSKTENAAQTTVMEQKSLSFGVGYGYNFVLKQKWLLHLSMIPMLLSGNKCNFTFDSQPSEIKKTEAGVIATGRLAVVYNFSRCYFSLNGVMTTHQFGDEESLSVTLTNLETHLDFGVRF